MVDKTRAFRKPDIDITEADFRARFSGLLTDAPPHTLRSYAFFSVPANVPPWYDTRLDLSAGEQVTVIAVGRTYLSRELNLCFDPDMQVLRSRYAALVSHR